MKKLIATAALAILPFTASAQGSFMNTHTLLVNMNHIDMTMMSYGYIAGVADADDGRAFCLPATGMDATTLASYVIREHRSKAGGTDHLRIPARLFIHDALSNAFPCMGSKPYAGLRK